LISTEKAFDMLPYAVDIFEKLDIQNYGIKKAQEYKKKYPDKNRTEIQRELGIELIKYVLKNSQKVKEEFFNIVALAADIDIETAKKRPFTESIQTFKEIFMDGELMDFFNSAMQ